MDFTIRFSESGLASIRSQLSSLRASVRSFSGAGPIGSLGSQIQQSISWFSGALQLAAGAIASGVALKFAEDFFKNLVVSNPFRNALIYAAYRLERALGLQMPFDQYRKYLEKLYRYLWRLTTRKLSQVLSYIGKALTYPFRWLLGKIKAGVGLTLPDLSKMITQPLAYLFSYIAKHLMLWSSRLLLAFSVAFYNFGKAIYNTAKTIAPYFGSFLYPFLKWAGHKFRTAYSWIALMGANAAMWLAKNAYAVGRASPQIAAIAASILSRLTSAVVGIGTASAAFVVALGTFTLLLHRGVQERLGRMLVGTANFVDSVWSSFTSALSKFIDAYRVGVANITRIWAFASESSLVRLDELQRRFTPQQIEEFKIIETVDARMQQNWEKVAEQIEIIMKRAELMFRQQNMQIQNWARLQMQKERSLL